MAKRGRPRKSGQRTKSGRLVRTYDRGTERAQAMRERFGNHCADALGRAYVSGLLGTDNLADAMLETGRSIARAYKLRFTVGRVRSALSDSPGGGVEDVERVKSSARWLDARLSAIKARGSDVRAAFDELVITDHADSGPGWMDRILDGDAAPADFGKLALALEGLEAALQ